MISVYFGNSSEIEKIGEVENEGEELDTLVNNFLATKGFKSYYYREWKIDTKKGNVTHRDFGSWSRFIYYGEESACRKYFIEQGFRWKS